MMKLYPVVITCLSLIASAPALAQIPVTDGALIASTQTAHIESIAKALEQLQQLRAQVEQARQQYAALTGGRGLGTILNNPQLRQYLPDDWKTVYDKIRENGQSGLTGPAKEIYESNKVYDTCANLVAEARIACEGRIAKNAQDQAFAMGAYQKSLDRLDQIEGLMRKVDESGDLKASADLQSRLEAEQAVIQNEQLKLELWAKASEAEDRLAEQRKQETFMQELSKPGGIRMKPIEWHRD